MSNEFDFVPPSEAPPPSYPEQDLPDPFMATDPAPPEPSPEHLVVQCYNCSTNIPVTTDERPAMVTCPGCGLQSVLE